jgi:hypothetical protein
MVEAVAITQMHNPKNPQRISQSKGSRAKTQSKKDHTLLKKNKLKGLLEVIMPKKIQTTMGGIKVVIKSQKFNLLAYKEVSGKVIVKASKSKLKKKDVKVFLKNTYYVQLPAPDPTSPKPVEVKVMEKLTTHKRRTVLREFAVGIGVKLEGKAWIPGQGFVYLPITGVRTEARITIAGETKEFVTSTGTVP